jgi:hypothetical protein
MRLACFVCVTGLAFSTPLLGVGAASAIELNTGYKICAEPMVQNPQTGACEYPKPEVVCPAGQSADPAVLASWQTTWGGKSAPNQTYWIAAQQAADKVEATCKLRERWPGSRPGVLKKTP